MTKVIRFLVKKKVHPHRENPGYAYARIKTSMSDFIWISLPAALEDDTYSISTFAVVPSTAA